MAETAIYNLFLIWCYIHSLDRSLFHDYIAVPFVTRLHRKVSQYGSSPYQCAQTENKASMETMINAWEGRERCYHFAIYGYIEDEDKYR